MTGQGSDYNSTWTQADYMNDAGRSTMMGVYVNPDNLAWTTKIRPQPVGAALARILGGKNRRRWMETPVGQMWIDPLSVLGQSLRNEGHYEAYIEEAFWRHARPGSTVLDVGANEGYFTLLASRLVGECGRVIAIEPQESCMSTLMQNLLANQSSNVTPLCFALGDKEGDATLHLRPSFNNGAASLVSRYRWSFGTETVCITTPQKIMRMLNIDHFDFVKIDVEGYEAEIVHALLPLVRDGRIGAIFLDCHDVILASRGIDSAALRAKLTNSGMKETGSGLYERA